MPQIIQSVSSKAESGTRAAWLCKHVLACDGFILRDDGKDPRKNSRCFIKKDDLLLPTRSALVIFRDRGLGGPAMGPRLQSSVEKTAGLASILPGLEHLVLMKKSFHSGCLI